MSRERAAEAVAFREYVHSLGDPALEALLADRDMLQVDRECEREIRAEWAAQARSLVPKDGGCQCNVCAITHALDVLTNALTEVVA